VDTIKAMHEGEVKVFFGMGGNFLSAAPDTAYTAEALRRCRLTAYVSTTLNRGHLVTENRRSSCPASAGRRKISDHGESDSSTVDSMVITNVASPIRRHRRLASKIAARMAKRPWHEEHRRVWSIALPWSEIFLRPAEQGRMSACSPVTRCPRLSVVETYRSSGSDASFGRVGGIGRGRQEVASHAKRTLDLALMHRLDRIHRVIAVRPWWLKVNSCSKASRNSREGRSQIPIVRHPARRMPTYAARAGARLPDVTTEQQQIDDLLDGTNPIFVLGEPIAQQQIMRLALATIWPAARRCSSGTPLSFTISSQLVRPRSAMNSSNRRCTF